MPQNGNFFKKFKLFALFGVLEVKLQFLAVLRHLEGFLEKTKESRPPQILKINGPFFLRMLLSKDTGVKQVI